MTRQYEGVSKFRDRYGKWRWRARTRGKKTQMLKGEYGSPDFVAQWEAWSAGKPQPIGSARTLPGTVNALLVGYYGAEHHDLASSTRAQYRATLERFRDKNGEKLQNTLTAENIARIRSKLKPEPSNMMLRALRHLCAYAVTQGKMKANPCAGMKKARVKTDGHRSWEVEDVEKFEAKYALGTKPRLAMALLLYTAQRRSDVVKLGKQHERGGGASIRFRQQKTNEWLELPIWSPLRAAIDAGPTGSLTYLETAYGKPHSAAGFGNWFGAKCRAAGLVGLTAHGLRKAAATRLAEAGASAHEIMSVTGHRSLSEAERYTKAVRQKQTAENAFGKLQTQFAKTEVKPLKKNAEK